MREDLKCVSIKCGAQFVVEVGVLKIVLLLVDN